MPFRTRLETSHTSRETWQLTRPLVWQGLWQYVVIREGFSTDFASIPKPLRWLLDNAGANAEAGVLHDAAWRESKLAPDVRRIDPWFADGMLRRALRETGSSALTRALIWFGVRMAASVSGRFGRKGPPLLVKIAQLLCVFLLGSLTALGPTIVAGGGLLVFWVFNWLFAVIWFLVYERRSFSGANWPFPAGSKNPTLGTVDDPFVPERGKLPAPQELLVIIPFKPDPYAKDAPPLTAGQEDAAGELAAMLNSDRTKLTDADIVRWSAMLSES